MALKRVLRMGKIQTKPGCKCKPEPTPLEFFPKILLAYSKRIGYISDQPAPEVGFWLRWRDAIDYAATEPKNENS
jgi:hypothetical protein